MNDGAAGIKRLQEYLAKKAKQAEPNRILAGQQAAAVLMQDRLRGRSSPRRTELCSRLLPLRPTKQRSKQSSDGASFTGA